MTDTLYRWVKSTERNPDDKADTWIRHQDLGPMIGWYNKDEKKWLTDSNVSALPESVEWLEPYTPSHIEDALKWFDSNKRTMGGIYAGEYIDRQDFEEFIQSLPIPSPGDNQSLESEIETEAAAYATGMMGIGEYNEKNWAYADKQTWHLIKRTYMRAAWKHPSRPSIDIVDELRKFGKYLAEQGWKPYSENAWENSEDDTASTETIVDDFLNQKEAK